MIDLRKKSLPDAITVDGKDFLLKTDFREWLKFSELIKQKRPLSEYFFLFKDEVPRCDFFELLCEFYLNENSTPQSDNNDDERVLDYIEDGEYIVASFIQAYGIDLTSIEYMHWHLFKALVIGLPAETMMSKIIGFRSWEKTKKSMDDISRDLKRKWALPDKEKIERDKQTLEEINNYFFGAR